MTLYLLKRSLPRTNRYQVFFVVQFVIDASIDPALVLCMTFVVERCSLIQGTVVAVCAEMERQLSVRAWEKDLAICLILHQYLIGTVRFEAEPCQMANLWR